MTAHDEDGPPAQPAPVASSVRPSVEPDAEPQVPEGQGAAVPPVSPQILAPPDFTGSQFPPPEPGTAGPRRTRRHRWLWFIFIVVVIGLIVASRVNLSEYAIEPGTAQSVQQFITVPADRSHAVRHPVLLTDVEIGRVTALTYLYYKVQSDTSLESLESVVGPFPPSQLIAQGNLEMSQAEAAAKTAALRRLGYTVGSVAAGAVVFGTFAGTPAASTLGVGDVIVAVNSTPVTTADELTLTLGHYKSGQTVTLSVRRGGTGAARPVPVTLRSTRVDVGAGHYGTFNLGIESEDQVDYHYPFPVNINVTNIGGPSAGLAMTLGVMDALTDGSITGGHTVAATGTIDAAGDVGDVGGVPQKTVAVERAGATIFLVPPQEYKAALSKDKPGLKIYAVSSLDQALTVLAAHGGGVHSAHHAVVTAAAG